ncbi:hypothetical protein J6590_055138 [Homalodisca vitripennis]|nr:hypothetical protein J6590_055138 [Homalodisca vitripennis]
MWLQMSAHRIKTSVVNRVAESFSSLGIGRDFSLQEYAELHDLLKIPYSDNLFTSFFHVEDLFTKPYNEPTSLK